MDGGLRLVEPLRRGDVKDRECGCEQFGAKHARNVNGFDGSHDDADKRGKERAISSSQEEAVIFSSLIMVRTARVNGVMFVPNYIPERKLPSCRIWLLQVRAARANGSTLIQPGFIR